MKLSKTKTVGAVALTFGAMLAPPAQAQATDPFIGQVSAFANNFCPRGWADANGQLFAISMNTALFSIFGTIYGGDGRSTFALPDLRGRSPIGQGNGAGLPSYRNGEIGGSVSFNLRPGNVPSHNHVATILTSDEVGNTNSPVRNSFAAASDGSTVYHEGAPAINNMHSASIRVQNAGSGQTVSKRSPYTTVRWCVSLSGVFPSRN